jgi:hypothetical protein
VSGGDVVGIVDIVDIMLGITNSLKYKPVQPKVRSEFMMKTVESLFLESISLNLLIQVIINLY